MVHKPLRRPETVLLSAAAALLLAAAAWAAVWIYGSLAHRSRTAVCVPAVMEDALPLPGLVLRQERALSPAGTFFRFFPAPGERVPAGAAIAVVYETGEEIFRAQLLLRLRQALSREEQVTELSPGEAARALSAAVAREDFSALPHAAQSLRLALTGPEEDTAELFRREIAALEAAGAESFLLPAPESGIFYPGADGWEALAFAGAEAFSPRELRYRLSHPPEPRGEAKLVTGSQWRFLALTDRASAARFAPGETVELLLPDSGGSCAGKVLSVRTGEGDAAIVCFAAADHLREASLLRQTTLTAVFARWEGLRLPAAAVREEEGKAWVLRSAGPVTIRTEVTVLARQGEDVLIAAHGLSAGTEVLFP